MSETVPAVGRNEPALSQAGDRSPSRADLRKVVTASSVGTLVEWYDFYIYGSLAVDFSGYFFPEGNPSSRCWSRSPRSGPGSSSGLWGRCSSAGWATSSAGNAPFWPPSS